MSIQLKADSFTNINVLVVGDVMLDRYWFGDVNRISPEAPVPVIAVKNEEARAGGAANVAHNVTALGAKCTLVSVTGDDSASSQMSSILESNGVTPKLIADPSMDTIVKLRMVAQNQQLLRADFDQSPSRASLDGCWAAYQKELGNADIVILSDYGKGCLSDARKMIALARQHDVPVVVDPKGQDYSIYQGASLITPNTKEFVAVAGEFADEEEFTSRAIKLKNEHELDALLVTRSEKGMSFIAPDNQRVDSPAAALEVYDVSGAGDTVIALMSLVTAAGYQAQDSLDLANLVAGIVVGKLGTAVATIDEVLEKLSR